MKASGTMHRLYNKSEGWGQNLKGYCSDFVEYRHSLNRFVLQGFRIGLSGPTVCSSLAKRLSIILKALMDFPCRVYETHHGKVHLESNLRPK